MKLLTAFTILASAAAWRPRGGGGGGGIGRFTGGFGGNVSPLPGEETGIFFLLPKKRYSSGNLKKAIEEENASNKKKRSRKATPKGGIKLFGVRLAGFRDPIKLFFKPGEQRGAILVREKPDLEALKKAATA